MPSYIELDKQGSFPASSDISKIILGINSGGALTLTDDTGNTSLNGSPAGNIGEIQYHSSSGAFGATSMLTYDEATSTLVATGSFTGSFAGYFTGAASQDTFTGIDISSGTYTINGSGVYEITVATTNELTFPDPTTLNGQTITIINTDAGNDITLTSNTYQPYQAGDSTQYSVLTALS